MIINLELAPIYNDGSLGETVSARMENPSFQDLGALFVTSRELWVGTTHGGDFEEDGPEVTCIALRVTGVIT